MRLFSLLMATDHDTPSFFSRGDRWALIAGVFAVTLATGMRFVVGFAYGSYEARQLMSSLVEGGFYLVSTIATASATIIALMLTVLGLTTGTEHEFSPALYGQIRWISILSAITMIGAVLTMLFMSVPLADGDNFPHGWIKGLYYVTSSMIALFSGLMVVVVIMLLIAVLGLVGALSPFVDSTARRSKD